MNSVRAGHHVLAIFYGHPGVCVTSSHRAIAIARSEGYQAKMLPGVSAVDYMFADIGFDPVHHGCTVQEATRMLVQRAPLDTTVHNIIFQVGCVGVGDTTFNVSKLCWIPSVQI